MEIRGELGLEPETNAQGDLTIQNNEDVTFPSPTPQSPQYSPESVVDSVSSSSVPLKINRATDLLMAVFLGAEEKIQIFTYLGLEKELEHVLETTAELESFNIFSGTVGVSRHSTTIHSLVETALKLLEQRQNHATEQ